MNTTNPTPHSRLFCLDMLRGLDMFLLTVIGPIYAAVNRVWGPFPENVQAQFDHRWGAFGLWDIIMPMFIFMCGAAVPLALKRRLDADGRPTKQFYLHVAWRFVMLWVLGMMVQGHLMSYNYLVIAPFNNTLQTIAVGYVIAAFTMLIPYRKVQVAVPIVLALIYTVALHLGGDYSRDGNFAWLVEKRILEVILPAGSKVIAQRDPGYTWFFTSLMFGAMTLCGAEATRILTDTLLTPWQRARHILTMGTILLGAGWLTYPIIPSIKHIYTFTFTAQAMGWCCLALGILFILNDILRWRRGTWIFVLYGQFALTAYMGLDFFGATINMFVSQLIGNLPNLIGNNTYQPLFQALGCAITLTLVLMVHRKLKQ